MVVRSVSLGCDIIQLPKCNVAERHLVKSAIIAMGTTAFNLGNAEFRNGIHGLELSDHSQPYEDAK